MAKACRCSLTFAVKIKSDLFYHLRKKKLFTCHHLLGLIRFHVTIILSCHFFRTGLSAASLLRIKGVCIVLEDNELQKKGGITQGKVRWMDGRRETATARMKFPALLNSASKRVG